jgi:predicted transport protein
MSDIKLFRIKGAKPEELEGKSVALEKSLQTQIEDHLECLLGVRFLATEYVTGKAHRGRIDTLGIDENRCPVIIEYKRSTNENVINQGLFYLDWLLDHRGEFQVLVEKKLGKEFADTIEWAGPRLLCIAGDFTKYDVYAVQQIDRNIELLRYKKYGDEFLLLDLVNRVEAEIPQEASPGGNAAGGGQYKSAAEQLASAPPELRDLYEATRSYLQGLGDDIQMNTLKCYFAFKRIKNFACLELRNKMKCLLIFVKVDPGTIRLEEAFTRDVSEIGHFGTGDLEISLRSMDDLERAKPLLIKSYETS